MFVLYIYIHINTTLSLNISIIEYILNEENIKNRNYSFKHIQYILQLKLDIQYLRVIFTGHSIS